MENDKNICLSSENVDFLSKSVVISWEKRRKIIDNTLRKRKTRAKRSLK